MKIRLKEFLIDEAVKHGVTQNAIFVRIKKGFYIGFESKKIGRNVFVIKGGVFDATIKGYGVSSYGIDWKKLTPAEAKRQWRLKTGRTKQHRANKAE